MIRGHGIDIIEIQRIQTAIDRWGDKFIEHVFVPEEIEYAQKYQSSAKHFAARFAAKEAVFKAIGDQPGLGWKDIQIYNDDFGRPQVRLELEGFQGKIFLSLSHSKTHAVASAVITE